LKKKPTIDELSNLIISDQMADEAWELLITKSPKCSHLGRIIKWGKVKVNEAAELSMQQNPTKKQLLEIFEYSDRKEQAAELLVKKRLGVDELVTVVFDSKNEKALELLARKVKFDRSKSKEEKLVREIATKLIKTPELLDANSWHNGGKHCFGGWAITLNEAAQKVEKEYSSEIAACLLLPNYTHLFYADKETVMDLIKNQYLKKRN
jgi:predicted restriction endonuclease